MLNSYFGLEGNSTVGYLKTMWTNVKFYTFRGDFEFYLIKFVAILYFPHLPCYHHLIILPFDGGFDRLNHWFQDH